MQTSEAQHEARWQAVCQRDATADGRFVYAVISTGIYCRPACPARRPKYDNTRFFDHAAAAEQAGFRPCRRCRPAQQQPDAVRLVTRLCRLIEAADTPPALSALAQEAGISPAYLQKLFKKITGLSPKAYAQAQRRQRLQQALTEGSSVTDAVYQAGFQSGSRFYEAADNLLGMAARRYRQGGRQELIRFACGRCSLGVVLVAQSSKGICAILLGDAEQPLEYDLRQRFAQADIQAADAAFTDTVQQVIQLIEQPQAGLSLPLDIRGTVFQQQVWAALQTIPAGTTLSYSELAQLLGRPSASRAVAGACAANALAVAIPCHRIVRSDGALSGYRWGVVRKKALLDRERKP